LGWWYYYFSKDQSLEKMEQDAKSQKLGLWQDSNAVSPWEYRKMLRNNIP
jgi:endonuclease YncB( thermonuclease family)